MTTPFPLSGCVMTMSLFPLSFFKIPCFLSVCVDGLYLLLVNLICVRNFGKVTFDISKHHDGKVSIKQLRNLEKSHIKVDKAILDLNFLLNCKALGVVPKFLCFNLPYTNHNDSKAIRRRLLRLHFYHLRKAQSVFMY